MLGDQSVILLGLPAPQIKLLAAQSAVRMGDTSTASTLALELAGAGYAEAADLAADVACGISLATSTSLSHAEAGSVPGAGMKDEMPTMFGSATALGHSKQQAAEADPSAAHLPPAQRVRLLAFAARMTQDTERLPLLVAELATAEQACLPPGGWGRDSQPGGQHGQCTKGMLGTCAFLTLAQLITQSPRTV